MERLATRGFEAPTPPEKGLESHQRNLICDTLFRCAEPQNPTRTILACVPQKILHRLPVYRAKPFPSSKTKSSDSAVFRGAHAGGSLQHGRHNLAPRVREVTISFGEGGGHGSLRYKVVHKKFLYVGIRT